MLTWPAKNGRNQINDQRCLLRPWANPWGNLGRLGRIHASEVSLSLSSSRKGEAKDRPARV